MADDFIFVYTDGSVMRPTDGRSPGGWAYYYHYNDRVYKSSGGNLKTTNNIMEVTAAMKAMQSLLRHKLSGARICIVSDSQYLVFGASEWITRWKRNRWLNGRNKVIKNKAMWKELDSLSDNFTIQWKWIKGHRGNPLNELVDKLAKGAAIRAGEIEEEYLKRISSKAG